MFCGGIVELVVRLNEEEDSVTCAGSSLVFLYSFLSANAIGKGKFSIALFSRKLITISIVGKWKETSQNKNRIHGRRTGQSSAAHTGTTWVERGLTRWLMARTITFTKIT